MGQHYKDLVVWQKAMDLVVELYTATEQFPKREVYSLTDQIRRAAVSVPSNVAEGQAHGVGGDGAALQRSCGLAKGDGSSS